MLEVTCKAGNPQPGWHFYEDAQNSIQENLRWRIASRPYVWRPPTDVFENEEAIIVRVEIAGMRESDFAIHLVDRNLQIRGVRQDIPERRAYHQMEIPFGEFCTEIELIVPIIPDGVDAVYRDGFLRVTLPKARPQHIKVGE
jgi:HSP20 family protein